MEISHETRRCSNMTCQSGSRVAAAELGAELMKLIRTSGLRRNLIIAHRWGSSTLVQDIRDLMSDMRGERNPKVIPRWSSEEKRKRERERERDRSEFLEARPVLGHGLTPGGLEVSVRSFAQKTLCDLVLGVIFCMNKPAQGQQGRWQSSAPTSVACALPQLWCHAAAAACRDAEAS